MRTSYQIIDKKDTAKSRQATREQLAAFLAKEGQVLLPMLDLIEQSQMAVNELIDVAGRATIEAVLELSARQEAGPRHPGKRGGLVGWHGRQSGVVALAERKLRVDRPRLRRRGQGPGSREVPIPAYQAMQDDERLGRRMAEILMEGVSTRRYGKVLPEMAETVGVSRSSVSREFIEASEESLKALAERRFEDKDILVIYLDGLIFGEHHVLSAVGVDDQGYKHVLGMVAGASENAAACKQLLEDIVGRGVDPKRKRLFVIDGSKALRHAVDAVFGGGNPVQRCRSHKVRNVADQLPKHLKPQVKAAMRAAYRLGPKEGMARLEQQARWLEVEYPSAAASLREGLKETFTINALDLPPSLNRCLATTNLIESPHSGIRQRTRRVSRWKDGSMALRWAATAMLATEKNFRRIMGYKDLWMLKSYLDRLDETGEIAVDSVKKVG
jgi:putative transposase